MQITWTKVGFIVVPATRTIRRILELVRATGARWIVLRRAVDFAPVPFHYVFRLSEIQVWAKAHPRELDRMADEALDLHETGASAESRGEQPRDAVGAPQGGGAAAERYVHMDDEGEPLAVGVRAEPRIAQPRMAQDAPAERSAGASERRSVGSLMASADIQLGVERSAREVGAAAAGGGPGASAAPLEVELSAQAPAELALGSDGVIQLQAAIAGTAPSLAHVVRTSLDPSKKADIVALLTIRGDALEAVDTSVARLPVPSAEKPESSSALQIRAQREGTAQIGLVFRHAGSELGTLTFRVRVVVSAPSRKKVESRVTAAPADAADKDLVLLLVDDAPLAGGACYRYRLVSESLGWDYLEFMSPQLLDESGGPASAHRFVESLYQRMTQRVVRNMDDANLFARELKGMGTDLSRQLFPSDLVRLLWDKRNEFRSVELKSWEPYIPWEVLRLEHPDTRLVDERYLAEYGLVRSLNGRSRPRQLALGSWRYLAAAYPNKLAAPLTAEKAVFTDVLQGRGIAATELSASPDAIYDALNEPDFDVLHICCHGKAEHENIEQAVLIIGDRKRGGVVEALVIDPATVRSEARLEARHPLVFLNACESARFGRSLTAWGGWPRTFWDAGAGAFIGTSWPVRDVPARAFCESFYGSLIDGQTLANAATAGREAAKAKGDATWLAYKVYGRPSSRKL